MRRTLALLLTAAALTGGLAACGEDDEPASAPTGTSTPAPQDDQGGGDGYSY